LCSCSIKGPYSSGSEYDDSETLCKYVDPETLPEEVDLEVPYVHQDNLYCGPASLTMVLNYYGLNVEQYEVGESIIGKLGSTPWDLRYKAESYGLEASVVSCGFNNLLELLAKDVPVIVRILNNSGTNGHFVVATGYDLDDQVLYINDPANEYRDEIPFEDFQYLWDINSLDVENNSENLMIIVKK
jgi:ABC-type bacteriocin/lantibiotic exporter with double-glycine peptidase domain